MKGTKRSSDSVSEINDSVFRDKRIMAGSVFDAQRAEPSQQQLRAKPTFDPQRAELSCQHVKALNNQFASWVQSQLKNHPDELWQDGVQDYLTHSSNIMEKFSDVVNWLKGHAVTGDSLSAADSFKNETKVVPKIKNTETKFFQGKPGFTPTSTAASFSPGTTTPIFSSSTTAKTFSLGTTSTITTPAAGFTPISTTASFSPGTTTPIFSSSTTAKTFSLGTTSTITTPADVAKSISPVGSTASFTSASSTTSLTPAGMAPSFTAAGSKSSFTFGGTSASTTTSFTSSGMSMSFGTPWSSGLLSNSQTPGLFGMQSSVEVNNNASDDAGDENELPQPSSPSVKKSEEKGIVVVHEVKCKLYVKSTDLADKDSWKDKGTGKLSIKCKEGIDKGSPDSKPTIVVRNDVGKVLLNALLYPGIKTSTKKNSLVAIFHTKDDGGDNENAVARTYLIRTKSDEARNKLATVIQAYAPAS